MNARYSPLALVTLNGPAHVSKGSVHEVHEVTIRTVGRRDHR